METASGVTVEPISDEEMYEVFDRRARLFLNMSGDEFQRAWHEGRFRDDPNSDVTAVAILMPGA